MSSICRGPGLPLQHEADCWWARVRALLVQGVLLMSNQGGLSGTVAACTRRSPLVTCRSYLLWLP